jgi:hypothetical protein
VTEEIAHFTAAEKQRERERGRGWDPFIPYKGTPSMTNFLQLGPTS